jgi:hypothetical protein
MPTLPSELEQSPSKPLEMDPNSPAVKDAVKAFLQERRTDAAAEVKPDEPPAVTGPDSLPAPQHVAIPPNNDFDQQTPPQDAMSNEAFLDLRKITVTTEEKEAYIKAIITGAPFRTTISLFNGRYQVELRTRSHYEQRRVYDAANLTELETGVPDDQMLRMALKITRFQQFCAAVMVERINGVLFSELSLQPGGELTADATKLLQFAQTTFENMGQVQWTAIINAMRIFESKCAQLASEAHNENFWTPPGSER